MPPRPLSYIPLPGDIVGAPPYFAKTCLMQGLFLKGDRAAQQALVEQALNRPAEGALIFHTVTDHVLVTGIYAETMGSTDAVDRSKGIMREWDVGFWTAVRGGRPGDEANWRLYWLPSFMFVDSAPAMASGREIYGYPKTVAAFSGREERDGSDASVSLAVQHFAKFGAEARPEIETLVTIRREPEPPSIADRIKSVEAAWDVFADITDVKPPRFNGHLLPPWPNLCMPQILLKQTRDPTAFGKASARSIIVVEPKTLAVTGAGPLRSPTVVTIGASMSHPIQETLGLKSSQEAEFGFWLTQDFVVGAADRLL